VAVVIERIMMNQMSQNLNVLIGKITTVTAKLIFLRIRGVLRMKTITRGMSLNLSAVMVRIMTTMVGLISRRIVAAQMPMMMMSRIRSIP
jgi:hypothetical protein